MAGVPLASVRPPSRTMKMEKSVSAENPQKRAMVNMAKTESEINPKAVKGAMDKPGDGIKLRTSESMSDPYKYMDSDSSSRKGPGAPVGEQRANLEKDRRTEDTVTGERSVVIPDARLGKEREELRRELKIARRRIQT